eukprot:3131954-Alexandrium_andersonii.AAC.1
MVARRAEEHSASPQPTGCNQASPCRGACMGTTETLRLPIHKYAALSTALGRLSCAQERPQT